MMLTTILTFVNLFAAAIIMLQSLCVMNKMNPHTAHSLRMAYLFISLGAFYTFLNPQVTTLPPFMMNLSMAYLLFIHKPKQFILKTNVHSFMVQKHG